MLDPPIYISPAWSSDSQKFGVLDIKVIVKTVFFYFELHYIIFKIKKSRFTRLCNWSINILYYCFHIYIVYIFYIYISKKNKRGMRFIWQIWCHGTKNCLRFIKSSLGPFLFRFLFIKLCVYVYLNNTS